MEKDGANLQRHCNLENLYYLLYASFLVHHMKSEMIVAVVSDKLDEELCTFFILYSDFQNSLFYCASLQGMCIVMFHFLVSFQSSYKSARNEKLH